jgi:hypothetical protein
MIALIILWVLCAGLAWRIGLSKGKEIPAFITGLMLGPLGVVAVLFWSTGA